MINKFTLWFWLLLTNIFMILGSLRIGMLLSVDYFSLILAFLILLGFTNNLILVFLLARKVDDLEDELEMKGGDN